MKRIANLDNAFEVLDELGVRRRLMRMLCHIQNSPTTNTYMYICVRKLERERVAIEIDCYQVGCRGRSDRRRRWLKEEKWSGSHCPLRVR